MSSFVLFRALIFMSVNDWLVAEVGGLLFQKNFPALIQSSLKSCATNLSDWFIFQKQ